MTTARPTKSAWFRCTANCRWNEQSEALSPDPQGRRRVVLATNVAESSVTLPGVRVVIDAGLAREPRFDPNSGFSRLETVTISQASADQRAGRAGRVAEGSCYRLWPESQRLDPARTPEIAQTELTALRLELAAWGSSDLRFFDAPPTGAMAAAQELLQRLGALDDRLRITGLGTRMLALGTHPRLAAMLLSGNDGEERALACDLAALLEARDPLKGYRGDDWAARWQALAAFRAGRAPGDRQPRRAGGDRPGQPAMATASSLRTPATRVGTGARAWRSAAACVSGADRATASGRPAALPTRERADGSHLR